MRRLLVLLGLGLAQLACVAKTEEPFAATEQQLTTTELTTFDARTGCCLEGEVASCGHYARENDVFLAPNPLPDGEYFFAVVLPTHLRTGVLDGRGGNLSDPVSGGTPGDMGVGDFVDDRTFSFAAGRITHYSGSHALGASPDGRLAIRLAPFDPTSALDGRFAVAVCRVGAASAAECRFDRFDVIDGSYCAPEVKDFRRGTSSGRPDFLRANDSRRPYTEPGAR